MAYKKSPLELARPHAFLIMKMKHGNPKLADFADTAIDVIRTLVTDPNAPPSVRLRAAKLIAKHNEYYKGGAKQTLEVLDQGLLRAAQQGRGDAHWLSAPQGLKVIRAYRSRIDGSLQRLGIEETAFGPSTGTMRGLEMV